MPNFCLINKKEVVVVGRGGKGEGEGGGGGGLGLVGQTGVPKPATNSSLRWRCPAKGKVCGGGGWGSFTTPPLVLLNLAIYEACTPFIPYKRYPPLKIHANQTH